MRERTNSGVPAAWELMQQRTFTKWVQTRLTLGGKSQVRVGDLMEDLRSGVVLCELMEVLRGERVKYNKAPTLTYQMRENVDIVLKLMEKDGLKMKHSNIGADNIVEGTRSITLGLVWRLILFYDLKNTYVDVYIDEKAPVKSGADRWKEVLQGISKTKTSITRRASIRDIELATKGRMGYLKLLINDLNMKLEPYNLTTRNLNADWKDGVRLTAIIDRFRPGFFNMMKEKSPREKVEEALKSGEVLGVSAMVEVEDVLSLERSCKFDQPMATYLKCFLSPALDDVCIPYTENKEMWGNYQKGRRNSQIIPASNPMLGGILPVPRPSRSVSMVTPKSQLQRLLKEESGDMPPRPPQARLSMSLPSSPLAQRSAKAVPSNGSNRSPVLTLRKEIRSASVTSVPNLVIDNSGTLKSPKAKSPLAKDSSKRMLTAESRSSSSPSIRTLKQLEVKDPEVKGEKIDPENKKEQQVGKNFEVKEESAIVAVTKPAAMAVPAAVSALVEQAQSKRRDSLMMPGLKKSTQKEEVEERDTHRTSVLWINNQLKKEKKLRRIKNIGVDIRDGVLLCELVEAIKNKPVSHHPNPRSKTHRLGNLNTAIELLKADGVKLANIGPRDIEAGNLELTRGLLWNIVMCYMKKNTDLGPGPGSGKQTRGKRRLTVEVLEKRGKDCEKILIEDLNSLIVPTLPPVQNLNKDWNNGLALSVLVDTRIPGVHSALKSEKVKIRVEKCMAYAEDYLKIERVIEVGDFMSPKVDTTVMLSYLSRFSRNNLPTTLTIPYQCVLSAETASPFTILKNTNLILGEYKIPPIKNFTSDWKNGKVLSALIDQKVTGFYEANLNNPPAERLKTALRVAGSCLDIPVTLDLSQVVKGEISEKTMIIYVNCFFNDAINQRQPVSICTLKETFDDTTLIDLINSKTKLCDVTVKNLTTDLQDGLALLALVNYYVPGMFEKYRYLEPSIIILTCLQIISSHLKVTIGSLSPKSFQEGNKDENEQVRELLTSLVSVRMLTTLIPMSSLNETTSTPTPMKRTVPSNTPVSGRVAEIRKKFLDVTDTTLENTTITLSEARSKGLSENALILYTINNLLKDYDILISDFTHSWHDGQALSALIDRKLPGFYIENMSRDDAKDRLQRCLRTAETELEIPTLGVTVELIQDEEKPSQEFISFLLLFLSEPKEEEIEKDEKVSSEKVKKLKMTYPDEYRKLSLQLKNKEDDIKGACPPKVAENSPPKSNPSTQSSDSEKGQSPMSPTKTFEESVDSLIRDIRLSRSFSSHSICCLESPVAEWITSGLSDAGNADDLLFSHTTITSEYDSDQDIEDNDLNNLNQKMSVEENQILQTASYAKLMGDESISFESLINGSSKLGTIEEQDSESYSEYSEEDSQKSDETSESGSRPSKEISLDLSLPKKSEKDDTEDILSSGQEEKEPEVLVARSPSRSKSEDTSSSKPADLKQQPVDEVKKSDHSTSSNSMDESKPASVKSKASSKPSSRAKADSMIKSSDTSTTSSSTSSNSESDPKSASKPASQSSDRTSKSGSRPSKEISLDLSLQKKSEKDDTEDILSSGQEEKEPGVLVARSPSRSKSEDTSSSKPADLKQQPVDEVKKSDHSTSSNSMDESKPASVKSKASSKPSSRAKADSMIKSSDTSTTSSSTSSNSESDPKSASKPASQSSDRTSKSGSRPSKEISLDLSLPKKSEKDDTEDILSSGQEEKEPEVLVARSPSRSISEDTSSSKPADLKQQPVDEVKKSDHSTSSNSMDESKPASVKSKASSKPSSRAKADSMIKSSDTSTTSSSTSSNSESDPKSASKPASQSSDRTSKSGSRPSKEISLDLSLPKKSEKDDTEDILSSGQEEKEPEVLVARSPSRSKSEDTSSSKPADLKQQPVDEVKKSDHSTSSNSMDESKPASVKSKASSKPSSRAKADSMIKSSDTSTTSSSTSSNSESDPKSASKPASQSSDRTSKSGSRPSKEISLDLSLPKKSEKDDTEDILSSGQEEKEPEVLVARSPSRSKSEDTSSSKPADLKQQPVDEVKKSDHSTSSNSMDESKPASVKSKASSKPSSRAKADSMIKSSDTFTTSSSTSSNSESDPKSASKPASQSSDRTSKSGSRPSKEISLDLSLPKKSEKDDTEDILSSGQEEKEPEVLVARSPSRSKSEDTSSSKPADLKQQPVDEVKKSDHSTSSNSMDESKPASVKSKASSKPSSRAKADSMIKSSDTSTTSSSTSSNSESDPKSASKPASQSSDRTSKSGSRPSKEISLDLSLPKKSEKDDTEDILSSGQEEKEPEVLVARSPSRSKSEDTSSSKPADLKQQPVDEVKKSDHSTSSNSMDESKPASVKSKASSKPSSRAKADSMIKSSDTFTTSSSTSSNSESDPKSASKPASQSSDRTSKSGSRPSKEISQDLSLPKKSEKDDTEDILSSGQEEKEPEVLVARSPSRSKSEDTSSSKPADLKQQPVDEVKKSDHSTSSNSMDESKPASVKSKASSKPSSRAKADSMIKSSDTSTTSSSTSSNSESDPKSASKPASQSSDRTSKSGSRPSKEISLDLSLPKKSEKDDTEDILSSGQEEKEPEVLVARSPSRSKSEDTSSSKPADLKQQPVDEVKKSDHSTSSNSMDESKPASVKSKASSKPSSRAKADSMIKSSDTSTTSSSTSSNSESDPKSASKPASQSSDRTSKSGSRPSKEISQDLSLPKKSEKDDTEDILSSGQEEKEPEVLVARSPSRSKSEDTSSSKPADLKQQPVDEVKKSDHSTSSNSMDESKPASVKSKASSKPSSRAKADSMIKSSDTSTTSSSTSSNSESDPKSASKPASQSSDRTSKSGSRPSKEISLDLSLPKKSEKDDTEDILSSGQEEKEPEVLVARSPSRSKSEDTSSSKPADLKQQPVDEVKKSDHSTSSNSMDESKPASVKSKASSKPSSRAKADSMIKSSDTFTTSSSTSSNSESDPKSASKPASQSSDRTSKSGSRPSKEISLDLSLPKKSEKDDTEDILSSGQEEKEPEVLVARSPSRSKSEDTSSSKPADLKQQPVDEVKKSDHSTSSNSMDESKPASVKSKASSKPSSRAKADSMIKSSDTSTTSSSTSSNSESDPKSASKPASQSSDRTSKSGSRPSKEISLDLSLPKKSEKDDTEDILSSGQEEKEPEVLVARSPSRSKSEDTSSSKPADLKQQPVDEVKKSDHSTSSNSMDESKPASVKSKASSKPSSRAKADSMIKSSDTSTTSSSTSSNSESDPKSASKPASQSSDRTSKSGSRPSKEISLDLSLPKKSEKDDTEDILSSGQEEKEPEVLVARSPSRSKSEDTSSSKPADLKQQPVDEVKKSDHSTSSNSMDESKPASVKSKASSKPSSRAKAHSMIKSSDTSTTSSSTSSNSESDPKSASKPASQSSDRTSKSGSRPSKEISLDLSLPKKSEKDDTEDILSSGQEEKEPEVLVARSPSRSKSEDTSSSKPADLKQQPVDEVKKSDHSTSSNSMDESKPASVKSKASSKPSSRAKADSMIKSSDTSTTSSSTSSNSESDPKSASKPASQSSDRTSKSGSRPSKEISLDLSLPKKSEKDDTEDILSSGQEEKEPEVLVARSPSRSKSEDTSSSKPADLKQQPVDEVKKSDHSTSSNSMDESKPASVKSKASSKPSSRAKADSMIKSSDTSTTSSSTSSNSESDPKSASKPASQSSDRTSKSGSRPSKEISLDLSLPKKSEKDDTEDILSSGQEEKEPEVLVARSPSRSKSEDTSSSKPADLKQQPVDEVKKSDHSTSSNSMDESKPASVKSKASSKPSSRAKADSMIKSSDTSTTSSSTSSNSESDPKSASKPASQSSDRTSKSGSRPSKEISLDLSLPKKSEKDDTEDILSSGQEEKEPEVLVARSPSRSKSEDTSSSKPADLKQQPVDEVKKSDHSTSSNSMDESKPASVKSKASSKPSSRAKAHSMIKSSDTSTTSSSTSSNSESDPKSASKPASQSSDRTSKSGSRPSKEISLDLSLPKKSEKDDTEDILSSGQEEKEPEVLVARSPSRSKSEDTSSSKPADLKQQPVDEVKKSDHSTSSNSMDESKPASVKSKASSKPSSRAKADSMIKSSDTSTTSSSTSSNSESDPKSASKPASQSSDRTSKSGSRPSKEISLDLSLPKKSEKDDTEDILSSGQEEKEPEVLVARSPSRSKSEDTSSSKPADLKQQPVDEVKKSDHSTSSNSMDESKPASVKSKASSKPSSRAKADSMIKSSDTSTTSSSTSSNSESDPKSASKPASQSSDRTSKSGSRPSKEISLDLSLPKKSEKDDTEDILSSGQEEKEPEVLVARSPSRSKSEDTSSSKPADLKQQPVDEVKKSDHSTSSNSMDESKPASVKSKASSKPSSRAKAHSMIKSSDTSTTSSSTSSNSESDPKSASKPASQSSDRTSKSGSRPSKEISLDLSLPKKSEKDDTEDILSSGQEEKEPEVLVARSPSRSKSEDTSSSKPADLKQQPVDEVKKSDHSTSSNSMDESKPASVKSKASSKPSSRAKAHSMIKSSDTSTTSSSTSSNSESDPKSASKPASQSSDRTSKSGSRPSKEISLDLSLPKKSEKDDTEDILSSGQEEKEPEVLVARSPSRSKSEDTSSSKPADLKQQPVDEVKKSDHSTSSNSMDESKPASVKSKASSKPSSRAKADSMIKSSDTSTTSSSTSSNSESDPKSASKPASQSSDRTSKSGSRPSKEISLDLSLPKKSEKDDTEDILSSGQEEKEPEVLVARSPSRSKSEDTSSSKPADLKQQPVDEVKKSDHSTSSNSMDESKPASVKSKASSKPSSRAKADSMIKSSDTSTTSSSTSSNSESDPKSASKPASQSSDRTSKSGSRPSKEISLDLSLPKKSEKDDTEDILSSGQEEKEPEVLVARSPSRSKSEDTSSSKPADLKQQPVDEVKKSDHSTSSNSMDESKPASVKSKASSKPSSRAKADSMIKSSDTSTTSSSTSSNSESDPKSASKPASQSSDRTSKSGSRPSKEISLDLSLPKKSEKDDTEDILSSGQEEKEPEVLVARSPSRSKSEDTSSSKLIQNLIQNQLQNRQAKVLIELPKVVLDHQKRSVWIFLCQRNQRKMTQKIYCLAARRKKNLKFLLPDHHQDQNLRILAPPNRQTLNNNQLMMR